MIVTKISPAATKIIQTSPFEHITLTGEYMVINVAKYVIGSKTGSFNDDNIFEIKFGNIKYEQNPDGTNGNPMLDTVITQRLKLTTPQVENWGTDDSLLIDIIAEHLKLTILDKQVMDMGFTL
jgi:hypothetical protein